MRQGEQRSVFLLVLDVGKEIHSVFDKVMLGWNINASKITLFWLCFFSFFYVC